MTYNKITEENAKKTFKTCREEIHHTVNIIIKSKGKNEFAIKEVIDLMKKNNTIYKDGTIRTHIHSKCCINSPDHHGTTYGDFERIGLGLYKIVV